MYISLWENSRGHPDNISFMQFSTKIDGFEQNDSQGFENSYNSYEQYPLENFFIFTIYQSYTLALTLCLPHTNPLCATLFWSALEYWAPFLEVLFSTSCIFLTVNRMEKPKIQINNACAQCEPETMGLASTIGVCITVQIGECGKQRVKHGSNMYDDVPRCEG